MMKINLNLHSSYSLNSNCTTKDILKEFNNFDIISITDHNSVRSCYELKNNSQIKFINGLEADAAIGDYTFDYLCYGFDLNEIDSWITKTYMTIGERQKIIFDKLVSLCKEKNIYLDMALSYFPEKEYAHDAIFKMLPKEFKEKYQLTDLNDFYRKGTTDKNFPLYLDMSFLWPSLEELIKIIHSNGGLVFLAHPKKYKFDYKTVLDLNKNIIDGIEISNNPDSQDEVEELYNYAIANNLKITYGTNYNGITHSQKEPMYINSKYEAALLSWINKY